MRWCYQGTTAEERKSKPVRVYAGNAKIYVYAMHLTAVETALELCIHMHQGERIIRLAEMCRKLETEEEKVMSVAIVHSHTLEIQKAYLMYMCV